MADHACRTDGSGAYPGAGATLGGGGDCGRPLLKPRGETISGGCGIAGTPVVPPSGKTEPIEKVKPGDFELSRDQNAGDGAKTEPEKVTRTFVHYNRDVDTVTFSDGATVTCTPQHPFYVHGRGFVPAGDLKSGDEVAGADGALDPVVSVAKHTGVATVYNFEVAGDHTYFVASSPHGLWVHNSCDQLARGRQMHREMSREFEGQPEMRVNRALDSGRRPDLIDDRGGAIGDFKSARDMDSARTFWQLSDYCDETGYEYGQIIPYP